ncbi:MAG: hypothetical protein V1758_03235 [Pseudomonadota bacterium]
MGNLLPLIIVGFFVYLVFFRRGGMGCCGSHADHDTGRAREVRSNREPYSSREEDVIDLREDQYTVLTSGDDGPRRSQGEASEEKSTWAN